MKRTKSELAEAKNKAARKSVRNKGTDVIEDEVVIRSVISGIGSGSKQISSMSNTSLNTTTVSTQQPQNSMPPPANPVNQSSGFVFIPDKSAADPKLQKQQENHEMSNEPSELNTDQGTSNSRNNSSSRAPKHGSGRKYNS